MVEGRFATNAVEAPADSVDFGVPWHYGDPFAEQRALVAGNARVDLSHRPVLRVSGSDRLSWLHSLTSQHLSSLSAGESALALLLDPRGRVEEELHLVETGDECLLSVEPGRGESVRSFLESMRFMLDVAVSDVSADWAVVGVDGESDGQEVGSGLPTWVMPAGFRERLARREVFVRRDDLPQFLADADFLAGTWAWEALRVAAGIPRAGLDTDNRTIPHEVGWIGPAVHLSKGCYRGQETVARVQNLGRPPRRLVLLNLDGSAPGQCQTGWQVRAEGRQVGVVGTAAQHFELGPIALATIKRGTSEDLDLEVTPQVEGAEPSDQVISASQEIIVASA